MASRTCEQCGAAVAQDEQFCPECGTFIDPLKRRHAPSKDNIISVKSDGNYEEFDLGTPPEEEPIREPCPTPPPKATTCPSCGAHNPPNNRHCQECGARLSQGPLPTAPRPAVQASAGVRAALAISALLFGVIVVALLFNIFNGEGVASDTTLAADTTTTVTVGELGPIDVLNAECTPDGIGAFVCDNLVSDSEAEYQINWEELGEGEDITIRLTFRQPMVVQRIDWRNLEDPTRFKQNYRARGIVIDAQDALQPFPKELLDEPGSQTIPYAAVNANWVEITVTSAFAAEVVDGNVFRELAINEITVIGRPASAPTTEGEG